MKARFPLFYKIAGACFGVALIAVGLVFALEYRAERLAMQDKFGLTLQHVGQTAALFLDGDAHERIHGNGDAQGADFQGLRAVLEKVRRENSLNPDQIYTLRPAPGGTGALEFVVMLQERTFVGDKFVPPETARPFLEQTWRDGGARYTPIYTDENGTFVSAYAPVRDHAGKVVAVLEVDYDVARFVAALHREFGMRLWVLPLALGLALLLALVEARSISAAVRQLVEGTERVAAGRYDRPVQVRTRDELRTLADAFNTMLGGLRERFAMLRFVPRHTRAVIAESVRDGQETQPGKVAERREVAVLFSDIRGFTELSERLPATRVIEMLNVFLTREAEIIEASRGSIDKFIGDAVMAVFEGPDRFADAVASAVAIQSAIGELNQRHAFDETIEVGIGVAGGEVVMGAVGYEGRMEFAVIGRRVNLASRLCGVAGRGEVMVSDEAFQGLAGAWAGEERKVKLKGFAGEVACFRVTAKPRSEAAN